MSRKQLENIGIDVLKSIVDQSGYTVTDLAKLCNITRSGFNVWLSSGKVPLKQFERLMVLAAFKDAEVTENTKPTFSDAKAFIPDFKVKLKNSPVSLLVDAKLTKPDVFTRKYLQAAKVDAVVYLENGQAKYELFDGNLAMKELKHMFEATNGEGTFEDPMPSNIPIVVKPNGEYVRHSYLLRPSTGHTVQIELPVDLTAKEADRLSLYIRSLVTEMEYKPKAKKERKKKVRK